MPDVRPTSCWVPGYSEVVPAEVAVRSRLTRNHRGFNIPLVSAAMDFGDGGPRGDRDGPPRGIGILTRTSPRKRRQQRSNRVKRAESGMIIDPVSVRHTQSSGKRSRSMRRQPNISGVPVVEGESPGRDPRPHATSDSRRTSISR